MSWPDSRPDDYDEDSGWDEVNGVWSAVETYKAKGGGKYRTQIVVIGYKKVYFEAVS